MTDRTTKALLLAIALGLWMNAAASWLAPVQAQFGADNNLEEIRDNVKKIANGLCLNGKIC